MYHGDKSKRLKAISNSKRHSNTLKEDSGENFANSNLPRVPTTLNKGEMVKDDDGTQKSVGAWIH